MIPRLLVYNIIQDSYHQQQESPQIRGPEEYMNMRISNLVPRPNANIRGTITKSRCLWDPCVYAVFRAPTDVQHQPALFSTALKSVSGAAGASACSCTPHEPSHQGDGTQRFQVPNMCGFWFQSPSTSVKSMVLGTRNLKYWILGPSGVDATWTLKAHKNDGQILYEKPNKALSLHTCSVEVMDLIRHIRNNSES